MTYMKFEVVPSIFSKDVYVTMHIIHDPTLGKQTPEIHCSSVYEHFLKNGTESGQMDEAAADVYFAFLLFLN